MVYTFAFVGLMGLGFLSQVSQAADRKRCGELRSIYLEKVAAVERWEKANPNQRLSGEGLTNARAAVSAAFRHNKECATHLQGRYTTPFGQ